MEMVQQERKRQGIDTYPRHPNAGDATFKGKNTFTLVFNCSESAAPARYSEYCWIDRSGF